MCEMLLKKLRNFQITDAVSTLEPEADDDSQAEQGGKSKKAWKKAEEYLPQLQDDDHMPTLGDRDVAIKRAEQYLHCSDGAGTVINVKVAFRADISEAEDRHTKFAAMEEKVKVQEKKVQAGIQREPSAAAMVYLCRGRLCQCALKRKADAANEVTQSKTAGRTLTQPRQRSTLRWQRRTRKGERSRSASLQLTGHTHTLLHVIIFDGWRGRRGVRLLLLSCLDAWLAFRTTSIHVCCSSSNARSGIRAQYSRSGPR